MNFVLPLPISPNRREKHPIKQQVQKDEYRKAAWEAALRQHKPSRDPPAKVVVKATLYLAKLLRDDDNANGSVKWVLDALRQKQQGAMRWRQGIADLCGYFIDDDPSHLTLAGKVQQVKVAHRKEERCELEITEVW